MWRDWLFFFRDWMSLSRIDSSSLLSWLLEYCVFYHPLSCICSHFGINFCRNHSQLMSAIGWLLKHCGQLSKGWFFSYILSFLLDYHGIDSSRIGVDSLNFGRLTHEAPRVDYLEGHFCMLWLFSIFYLKLFKAWLIQSWGRLMEYANLLQHVKIDSKF